VGIILATGVYMILGNLITLSHKVSVKTQPLILTIILAAILLGVKVIKKKKVSPIMTIIISAVLGVVIYGF
jgi:chromate transporter